MRIRDLFMIAMMVLVSAIFFGNLSCDDDDDDDDGIDKEEYAQETCSKVAECNWIENFEFDSLEQCVAFVGTLETWVLTCSAFADTCDQLGYCLDLTVSGDDTESNRLGECYDACERINDVCLWNADGYSPYVKLCNAQEDFCKAQCDGFYQ